VDIRKDPYPLLKLYNSYYIGRSFFKTRQRRTNNRKRIDIPLPGHFTPFYISFTSENANRPGIMLKLSFVRKKLKN
jgi:hypothetical protein